MSEAANLLAFGPVFEFRGQSYQLTPRTLKIEIAFGQWLERKAIDKLRQHADFLTAEEFLRRERGQQQDFDSGLYEYHSERCHHALNTVNGAKYLCYLQLREANQDTVTPWLIEQIWEEPKKRDELLSTLRRINDPNPPAAETSPTSAGASPSDSRTSSPS